MALLGDLGRDGTPEKARCSKSMEADHGGRPVAVALDVNGAWAYWYTE
jgi:hypothetical protein